MSSPIEQFPSLILHHIFNQCDLSDIKNIASTCKKFSGIFNDQFFWKTFVPHLSQREFKSATSHFFQHHKDKMSWLQATKLPGKGIAYLNVRGEELGQFALLDQNSKSYFLMRLIYAIRMLDKHFSTCQTDKYDLLPHLSLLICWKRQEPAYEFHFTKQYFSKYPETWEEAKQRYATHEKKNWENREIKLFDKLLNLFYLSDFKSQCEASLELSEFYTEIWRQYNPKQFDTGLLSLIGLECSTYSFMPVEAFSGLCNYIYSQKKFDSMSHLYFTEEHLNIWNLTFANEKCLLNKLAILLLPDIKQESLERFLVIIQRESQFKELFVCCLSANKKISECFSSLSASKLTHVKAWRLIERY